MRNLQKQIMNQKDQQPNVLQHKRMPTCQAKLEIGFTSQLWDEGTISSSFFPLNMSIPTKWHFACPCFPVFEVETSTTWKTPEAYNWWYTLKVYILKVDMNHHTCARANFTSSRCYSQLSNLWHVVELSHLH